MPKIGLEPTYLAVPEPKSGVSTNSTTWAGCGSLLLGEFFEKHERLARLKELKFKGFIGFCQTFKQVLRELL
jgi:hypothetical protein